MLKYLKYYITPFISFFIMFGIILGGNYMWFGIVEFFLILFIGDAIFSEDLSEAEYNYPLMIEIPLFLSLPILITLLTLFSWSSGSGNTDLFGIGSFVNSILSYDIIQIRNNNNWFHYLGGLLTVGFTVAGIGTNIGHELVHRTNDKISLTIGRWLLSMSCNADFSIEHVYGHHVNVCTDNDPASAKKGENVYYFSVKSSLLGHISAWRIEIDRLKKKNISLISFNNKILTGYLMSMSWFILFYMGGGIFGVFLFSLQAIIAKFILEIVNYFEHYGLRRNPNQYIGPEHSWNTNKRLSSMVLFSLTRHSAHHEKPRKEFWKLSAYREAPQMPYGYFTTLLICLIPPFWHSTINPLLLNWEKQYENEVIPS